MRPTRGTLWQEWQFEAFTLNRRKFGIVAIYALFWVKLWPRKRWSCNIFDKYHVWSTQASFFLFSTWLHLFALLINMIIINLVVHDLPGGYFFLQTESCQCLADNLRDCWYNCKRKRDFFRLSHIFLWQCFDISDQWPWLTISSPAGPQASPGLRRMKIVFSGSVWKYSPSSTLEIEKSKPKHKCQY